MLFYTELILFEEKLAFTKFAPLVNFRRSLELGLQMTNSTVSNEKLK